MQYVAGYWTHDNGGDCYPDFCDTFEEALQAVQEMIAGRDDIRSYHVTECAENGGERLVYECCAGVEIIYPSYAK